MKEDAERIIEMFKLSKQLFVGLNKHQQKKCAILHVEGLIKELEYHKWQNRLRVEYWQDVLEIIKNK